MGIPADNGRSCSSRSICSNGLEGNATQRINDCRLYAYTPMSVPITIVAVILQVTGIWNDFIFALVFAGRENLPMTVQLNNIVRTSTGTVEYSTNMAATILTGAVPLIVYFVSGKWFVRGIAAGGAKG